MQVKRQSLLLELNQRLPQVNTTTNYWLIGTNMFGWKVVMTSVVLLYLFIYHLHTLAVHTATQCSCADGKNIKVFGCVLETFSSVFNCTFLLNT